MDNKIDFLILWVDGSDENWLKEKEKYNPKKIKNDGVNGAVRYRDWDNLKYWFRGVEKFAPWVNKVFFVTYGHLPKWLNVNNPKLKIINHKDYIPKKYLPTFSSNPIILNLNRIKELSEHFVFFNDDMFLLDDLKKSDFFINGKPVDNYMEVNWDSSNEDPTFAGMLKNNYDILSKYYKKRRVILTRPNKFFNIKYGFTNNLRTLKTTLTKNNFVGIYNNHIPQPFLKSYFDKLWELEKEKFEQTSSNKFRTKDDVTEYLIRYFQLLDCNFVPKGFDFGKYFSVKDNNDELISYIKNQKGKCVCINDTDSSVDFEKSKKEINSALENILSKKCSFEK